MLKEKTKERDTPDLPSKKATYSKYKPDVLCAYCKAKSHVKTVCWKLKWKENISPNIPTSNTVAATKKTAKTENTSAKDNTTEIPTDVACIRDNKTSQIQTDKSIVKVNYVEGNKCNLLALIDTGSSVSFIQRSVCKLLFGLNFPYNVTNVQHLCALNDSQSHWPERYQ